MHDIRAIRENPQVYVAGWSSRGVDEADGLTADILRLDGELRHAQTTGQDALAKAGFEVVQAEDGEHGLEVLAYPINDVPGNCTRFLLLRRGERSLDGPLASLAFSLHANRPGALLEALACFGHRALNMSRIESRPSKREMGEYIFFVDLELPEGKEPLLQALEELQPLCEHLAVFGAYPLTQLEEADAA